AEDAAGRGAGGEADEVGAAQRVPGEALEDRPAQPERGADQQPGGHARGAQLVDDQLGDRRAVADQGGQDVRHRYGELAGGDRRHRDHAGDHQQQERHGQRARRQPERPGAKAEVHSAAILLRRAIMMKIGAPIAAHMMPTCTSPGRAISRPATSAPSSSTGATTAEYGSTHRWSWPTTARTACGTASPTNHSGPAAAVADPHSSVTASAVS